MSPNSFVLSSDDPVVQQFRSGLDVWERPFDVFDKESLIPVSTRGTHSGEKFMAGLLGPRPLRAAPAGERALVINTAQEMPIEVVDPDTGDPLRGFKLNIDGHVTFGVRLQDLSCLPLEDMQPFFVDVLFVPAGEIVCQQRIGSRERVLLNTMLGLRFDFELPGFDEFLGEWRARLQSKGQDSILLPRTAIALRIWWD